MCSPGSGNEGVWAQCYHRCWAGQLKTVELWKTVFPAIFLVGNALTRCLDKNCQFWALFSLFCTVHKHYGRLLNWVRHYLEQCISTFVADRVTWGDRIVWGTKLSTKYCAECRNSRIRRSDRVSFKFALGALGGLGALGDELPSLPIDSEALFLSTIWLSFDHTLIESDAQIWAQSTAPNVADRMRRSDRVRHYFE